MMRLAFIVSVCAGLSMAACGRDAPEGLPSMDVAEHIISLERAALERTDQSAFGAP